MEKQRVEALSDAILAIIVTIMALELQLPEELTVVGLRSMLPMLFIYIASFLQIMAVWLYYHELYKLVDHVSFHLFGANSFWLLTASFVPLATRGIGQNSASFDFLLFYLIVLALWDVAWIIMTAMVIKTSQRPLSVEEKKIPYRWALLYGLQLVIILLVGYLFPNLIPIAPLLMIVNVIYGFLSNKS